MAPEIASSSGQPLQQATRASNTAHRIVAQSPAGQAQPRAPLETPPPNPLPEFLQLVGYPYSREDMRDEQHGIMDDVGEEMEAMYTAHTLPVEGDYPCVQDYAKWPYPTLEVSTDSADLYEAARHAKVHGATPPRVDHTASLNTQAWEALATGHADDDIVLNGFKYGFSIQYVGPPRYQPSAQYNHSSATHYPMDTAGYITEETRHKALEGPFTDPPFTLWFYTSPMMSREKRGGSTRRIIVDLSYPDGGLNAHIQPHIFEGKEAVHNLPSVDAAVNTVSTMCPGDIHMSVIDISRAYRNFPVSPLDWPLLGLWWDARWSFDRRLPFGERMSSFAMQMAANFIVRALSAKNITAHMYLDDVIVISPTKTLADQHYKETLALLNELGLQIAIKKLQPLATRVTWLGITVDVANNTLSIPKDKLAQIKDSMAVASRRKSITRRHLQRLIGLANHLAKVVRAARIFICRLLAAIRAAPANYIKVTPHIRADLAWFAKYLRQENRRAIIPSNLVVQRIWVDACLKGAGASDGKRYYEFTFKDDFSAAHHITQLEALNCLAAVRTFVDATQAGGTVQVYCDNQPAVDALTSGRAKDNILAACARALWLHAANTDTDIRFAHVPGEGMSLPDALSRASLGSRDRRRADHLISSLCLAPVDVGEDAYDYSRFT